MLTWENWQVHNIQASSLIANGGWQLSTWRCLVMPVLSECETGCFCSWTKDSVTRDKGSQRPTVRQGGQSMTFCWATSPLQGNAWWPELDWQGLSNGNESSLLSQNRRLAQELPDAQDQFWIYRICHPNFVSPKWLYISGLFFLYFFFSYRTHKIWFSKEALQLGWCLPAFRVSLKATLWKLGINIVN